MTSFKILETESFRKFFSKLAPPIRRGFEKKISKVQQNPYGIGKKLKAYNWFRELKIKGFRIYYIVYDNQYVVLFVGGSAKKNQQKAIDLIMEDFENIAENIIKDESLRE